MEKDLDLTSLVVARTWKVKQNHSSHQRRAAKARGESHGFKRSYVPPAGLRVRVIDCFQPGVYARNGHHYVKTGESDMCEYLVSHRINNRIEVLFKCVLPPSLAGAGVAMLYSDSLETRSLDFNYIWRKGEIHAPDPREHIKMFFTTPFCEVFSPRKNFYDVGYPSGPPMEQAVRTIFADLLVTPPTFDEDVEDEDLYWEFVNSMGEFITSPITYVARTGKTRKLGVSMARDLIDTFWFRRGDVDDEKFLAAREKLKDGPLCVGVLPKIGAVKSDGSLRRVFPMSPTLQICLEEVVGKRSPRYLGVTLVRGASFPSHKYCYDVKSADRKIGPYFHKWLRDYRPDLIPVFFPPIVTPDGVRYSDQFLSGLLGTTYIVEAFTVAVGRQATQGHLYIQGDGIMTDHPIEHELLRENPAYTINGFYYGNGEPEFVNGPLRLSSPRIHNPGKLNGADGWMFRYEIYLRFLNARNLPAVARKYGNMRSSDLLLMAFKNRVCQRKLAMMGLAPTSHLSDHQWDYVQTEGRLPPEGSVPFINTRAFPPLLPLGASRREDPTRTVVKGLDCSTHLTRHGGVPQGTYQECVCELWAGQYGSCSACGAA